MAGASGSDGLVGEWLSLDDIASLELFQPAKRAFKVRLNSALAPRGESSEPGIKAAVRRRFSGGETICQAGAYGSTAFVILEGQARLAIPKHSAPVEIAGNRETGWGRLRDMFRRRSQARKEEPTLVQIGEVSSYGNLACSTPPEERTLGPGDVFGVDACINYYPREATVVALGEVVVVEFLRSLLDAVRDAGKSGDAIWSAYTQRAVRSQIASTALFAGLPPSQIETLAAAAELLTPDSDEIEKGLIYEEDVEAGALYLVRAGTIKLSRQRAGGEFVFSYVGCGGVFGLERVVPARRPAPLVLRSVSHPREFPVCEIRDLVRLGRRPDCELRFPVDDHAVSRLHCTLEERDGDVYLTDKDSANLTLLNGEPIREAVVMAGDTIKIVGYEFELSRPAPDATVVGQEPKRLATATALDNFELVKIDAKAVRRVATEERVLYDRLTGMLGAADPAPLRETSPDPAVLSSLVELNLYNAQNTLLIDLERCTRCDECVRACADAHGGVTRFTRDGPRFGKYLVTLACRSCTDPKCMIGCPVGSIRREDSLQIRIEDWCIGCQKCANQCPFGNINILELSRPSAESPQLRATVCDLCVGYDGPNCVYACPHDAAIRVNPASFLSVSDTL